MKLHFEPKLDYQLKAIELAFDLFRGEELCRTEFTIIRSEREKAAEYLVARPTDDVWATS